MYAFCFNASSGVTKSICSSSTISQVRRILFLCVFGNSDGKQSQSYFGPPNETRPSSFNLLKCWRQPFNLFRRWMFSNLTVEDGWRAGVEQYFLSYSLYVARLSKPGVSLKATIHYLSPRRRRIAIQKCIDESLDFLYFSKVVTCAHGTGEKANKPNFLDCQGQRMLQHELHPRRLKQR